MWWISQWPKCVYRKLTKKVFSSCKGWSKMAVFPMREWMRILMLVLLNNLSCYLRMYRLASWHIRMIQSDLRNYWKNMHKINSWFLSIILHSFSLTIKPIKETMEIWIIFLSRFVFPMRDCQRPAEWQNSAKSQFRSRITELPNLLFFLSFSSLVQFFSFCWRFTFWWRKDSMPLISKISIRRFKKHCQSTMKMRRWKKRLRQQNKNYYKFILYISYYYIIILRILY